MAICGSVERKIRVRGSCTSWFPVVRECLSSRGFRNIAVDADLCRLTAEYGGPGSPGGISVLLSPSSSCGETDVVVVATASLKTERFCWCQQDYRHCAAR